MTVSWNTPVRLGALILLRTVSQASLSEWRKIKRSIKVLEFKDEERNELEMRVDERNGQLTWNEKKGETEKEFDIEDKVIFMLNKQVMTMDKQSKIIDALIPLAEKLIPEDGGAVIVEQTIIHDEEEKK